MGTCVRTYIHRYATYLRSSQDAVPLSLPCHDLSSTRTVHLSRSRCRSPNCPGVTFGTGCTNIPPRKCSLKPMVFRRNVNATSSDDDDGDSDGNGDGNGNGNGNGDGDGRFIQSCRKDVRSR